MGKRARHLTYDRGVGHMGKENSLTIIQNQLLENVEVVS